MGIPQTASELEQHLNEHLEFLQRSAVAYDEGLDAEAKRLAVSLRVLLHDTNSSHSLLGQLGRFTTNFISTAIPHDQGNIGTHGGLVMATASGPDSQYVAMLDDVPYCRWLPFQDWWNEVIFVDGQKQKLARKQLVLAVANQDGGAHVDPALNETYARLSRHNSLGWVVSDGSSTTPIPKAERAAIRQISHEVLRTLVPAYRRKPNHGGAFLFGGAMIHEGSKAPPMPKAPKIGRNDRCPCGNGKKYKKCHGAAAV